MAKFGVARDDINQEWEEIIKSWYADVYMLQVSAWGNMNRRFDKIASSLVYINRSII